MTMRLHDYGDRAEHVCAFPAFPRNALVFGVELEVEPRQHASQYAILRALPARTDYFCKTDGSLQSGVEIVTVPMTLAQHKAQFDWPGVLTPLLGLAMSGSRTQRCGMHIHVNRRAMSALTLAKMYLFINEPANLQFIETVAQRSNNNWAKMAKKEWANCLDATGYRQAGRYQALNLTANTAELRLFRGTIRLERLYKNLEFAHALVSWCRENSATDVNKVPAFLRFVETHGEWPNLSNFLREVGVNA